jgi:hypothetical protein
VLSLQGEDSVSSNAGPAAAGASVPGNLVDRSGVGDAASCMAGLEMPLPADSAASTRHDNPQSTVSRVDKEVSVSE